MQRRNKRFVERLPFVLSRRAYVYALTTLFCIAALLLRFAAQSILPTGYPFVSFFPAVILASFLFGARPGIFAGLLCGLFSWYFFIPPVQALSLDLGVAIALCFYTMVVAVDIALIHLMQRANFNLAVERERSRTLADNRELLFHELQHRVSNNLQVVAAMLALQRRHIEGDAPRRALDEASGRVALIGKISRALYDPSGAGQSLAPFLDTLVADVVEASGRADVEIRADIPADVRLQSHVAIPLALIVAEAVSNAIEHGFADRGGIVSLSLAHDEGSLCLFIADDGKGLAPGFDPAAGSNLGLKIAHALAGQIGGCFALAGRPEGGALARLDLPDAMP